MSVYIFLERQTNDWIQTKSSDNREHAQQHSNLAKISLLKHLVEHDVHHCLPLVTFSLLLSLTIWHG